jgi:hypothetical protein
MKILSKKLLLRKSFLFLSLFFSGYLAAQEILPFPPAPSGSKAGITME